VSFSKKNVLRGLHYQHTNPQGKLITVLQGAIFDVAVDMRRGSATFGAWCGIELTQDQAKSIWVPPGFAHGIFTLSDTSLVSYKVTGPWVQSDEIVISWSDPSIDIAWPLAGVIPLVSDKDKNGIAFDLAPKFDFLYKVIWSSCRINALCVVL
jgi:dTDP-4-dehydrorhamnose 3,5-epimerase